MRPIPTLLAPLLAFALVAAAASTGWGQRLPRQLEDIRIFGKGESVEFVFSKPYQGNPRAEYKPGAFTLNFSGTGSPKPARTLRPKAQSLYREVRIVQNRYSTSVSFLLKDPKAKLENRLAFTPNRNILRMVVNEQTTPPALSPQGREARDVLRQVDQRIGAAQTEAPAAAEAEGTGLALGGMTGGEFFYSIVKMVLALLVIIAGLYAILYLYNRLFGRRLRKFTGTHTIKQLASFHIGPRQRVIVLDINGEIVACGVTPNQISYLTHLGAGGGAARALQKAAKGLGGKQAGTSAEEGGAAEGAAAPDGKTDSVHQFAQLLKQKVRSLKRIN